MAMYIEQNLKKIIRIGDATDWRVEVGEKIIFFIFFFLRKLSLRLEHNSCYAPVVYNKNIFNIIHILYPVYLLKYDNLNQFE